MACRCHSHSASLRSIALVAAACVIEFASSEAAKGSPFLEEHTSSLVSEPHVLSEPGRQLASEAAHGSSSSNGSTPVAGQSSSSGCGSSASEGHGGEHASHPHDAVLYLVLALITGTAVLHLTMHPWFHSVPYTVVLFVLGFLTTLVHHATISNESLGILGKSYEMWMNIDPHLLMFTMLPVLLTGDAMAIDTAVAKRVAGQCLYLAGPGVLMSAFATAGFFSFYFQWPFLLCLCMGAVLAATDPVAVVGLLKELGASPKLTIQIQGESLLNDGTAMVLFSVAYEMLKGVEYDAKKTLFFLLYMIVGSMMLGTVLGNMFSAWIRAAGQRNEHHASTIQISLTVCCAYGTFCLAEGVMGISGVLCTVAAAFVMADSIWPKVVSKESMHEVWHTFEYLGNTVIFFLAGGLTGNAVFSIEWMDWLHLLVIYVVLTLIRAFVLFASRPLLKYLSADGTPVSWREAAVMTWGGLRGAVGLALAIRMKVEKADGAISSQEADRVLFFTGGIAALTLIINATTCPMLVKKLGITGTVAVKAHIVQQIRERLLEITDRQREPMRSTLKATLSHDVDGQDHKTRMKSQLVNEKASKKLKREYQRAKEAWTHVSQANIDLMGFNSESSVVRQADKLIELLEVPAQQDLSAAMNSAFLTLVNAEYWELINDGTFIDGSQSAEVLLNSVIQASQHCDEGLVDLIYLEQKFGLKQQPQDGAESSFFLRQVSGGSTTSDEPPKGGFRKGLSRMGLEVEDGDTRRARIRKSVESLQFTAFVVSIIMVNTILIFVSPGDDKSTKIAFIVLDGVFLIVYIVELLLKLFVYRLNYFKEGWNLLDLACVVLGILGLVLNSLVEAQLVSIDALSSELMLIKLGRVFKILRLVRVVLLVKFVRKLHAKLSNRPVSATLACALDTVVTLQGFVLAHQRAQNKFLKFFSVAKDDLGIEHEICEGEEARCMLQSLTNVYRAVCFGATEAVQIDNIEGHWVLEGLENLRSSIQVTHELKQFVLEATNAGTVTHTEAEDLIHPLQGYIRCSMLMMKDTHAGIHREFVKDHSVGIRQSNGENVDINEDVDINGDVIVDRRLSIDENIGINVDVDINGDVIVDRWAGFPADEFDVAEQGRAELPLSPPGLAPKLHADADDFYF